MAEEKRAVGRPAGEEQMKRVAFAVPRDIYIEIRERAKQDHRNISEYVRWLVINALKKER